MKECSVCKLIKPLTEYRIGYAKCNACRYEYEKLYRQTEKGKLARKKEAINARLSGKKKERQKRYKLTEKAKVVAKRYEKKRCNTVEGKAKLSAKNAVRYALRIGKIVKQPCFICGEVMSQAHHSSYAQDMRLNVTWLCPDHHNEIHNPLGGM